MSLFSDTYFGSSEEPYDWRDDLGGGKATREPDETREVSGAKMGIVDLGRPEIEIRFKGVFQVWRWVDDWGHLQTKENFVLTDCTHPRWKTSECVRVSIAEYALGEIRKGRL